MKKIVLTAFAVFSLTVVNAQEEKPKNNDNEVGYTKGDVFLTGGLGLYSHQYHYKGFYVAPSMGYFATKNIAFGTRLELNSSRSENIDYKKRNSIAADFFGRYYFKPSATFSIFTELSTGYYSAIEKHTHNNIVTEYKTDGFRVGINPGISYFVSKHFAIEAKLNLLNFTSYDPYTVGGPTTNNVDFGLNLNSLNFGLIYKI